jgi:diadenosine tetraphosphatase ApaH/serine/threonine PP2A family protein phosphatase
MGEEIGEAGLNADRARWSAEQLQRGQRAWLAALPDTQSLDVDGLGPTLFCHGSPRSDEEILTAISSELRVGETVAGVAEQIVVCGHTHVQFDRAAAGKRLVNAGSVGMPYESLPGAYWALFGPGLEMRRTDYDREAAAEAIRATTFPDAREFAEENVLTIPSGQEATELFERMATANASQENE